MLFMTMAAPDPDRSEGRIQNLTKVQKEDPSEIAEGDWTAEAVWLEDEHIISQTTAITESETVLNAEMYFDDNFGLHNILNCSIAD